MVDFLEKVLANTKETINNQKKKVPLPELRRRISKRAAPLAISQALLLGYGIIAEIKRASPSQGVLFFGDRLDELGRAYQENGASAVSLLTENLFFHGRLDDLARLKDIIRIPVLRKDFIIDEYQVVESRAAGADALLLIVALLPEKGLSNLLGLTRKLGMEALVEVHTRDELFRALDSGAEIIGINNRNLKTLEVNLDTARNLLPLIPETRIKVVESGIKEQEDLLRYRSFNVDGFLIGEVLVTSPQPGKTLQEFCSVLEES